MLNKLYLPLKKYKRRYIKDDLIAALVVTAIAIPESLGFAVIVGVPIQVGLYCALAAPIVFALLTSSRRLVVGADSATAALVAAGASTVAVAGSGAYLNAISMLGVITGIILLIMAMMRLGFLADLISRPVLIGFLAGVGLQLIIGKFPEMIGIEASGSLANKIITLVREIGTINLVTAALSGFTVFAVLAANKRRWPGVLVGLVLASLLSLMLNLKMFGVHPVGSIPWGLPALTLPDFNIHAMIAMLPAAIAIAMVILAQSLTVIRSSAAKFDEKTRDNQDLAALGLANMASAFTGGFAINGSPPRTMAGEVAGGRSQMVNIFMALMVACVLLFATGLFEYIPASTLATIVFCIGLHLISTKALVHVWRTRREEFYVALVAMLGVAFLGVQQGVLIAVIVSLLERLRRQYRPHDQVLLRDRVLDEWLRERLEKDKSMRKRPAGLLIYRFSGSLFFENSSYFLNRATQAIERAKDPVHTFIVDAGSIDDIDFTAAEMIKRFHAQLNRDDIRLAFAHVPPYLRTVMDRFDLVDLIGEDNIYNSLTAAIKAYPDAHRSIPEMIAKLELPEKEYVLIGGGVLDVMGIRETNDVDVVVSDKVYKRFRAKGWKEYTDDAGKKTLSKRGYQIMKTWMKRDLNDFKRNAKVINGVMCISLEDLIDCKKRMGRDKDMADVRLVQKYIKARKDELAEL